MDTVIDKLNKKAIKDAYLYKLLEKVQVNYGRKLFNENFLKLSDKELSDILRFSDILSRSEIALHRNIALKIISTLFEEYKEVPIFQLFAQNTMIKVGNFPSLGLIKNIGLEIYNSELEAGELVKKTFQQTSIEDQYFTDSQYEIFQRIINSNHFSFSAGTSFGKSFLFMEYAKWLIREKNASENIVFLVPTRALIAQLIVDLKANINNENYRIVTNPDIPAFYKNKKFIFVFTPERLVSYFSKPNNPNISTMIIDEAHNIVSNDERAPLFYHAITIAEQKSVNLYFASPNVPNPELFLELFGNSTEESKSIEDVNVVQNKYFIDFIDNKVHFYFDFIKEQPSEELPLKWTSFEELVVQITQETQSIIYCNSIKDTVLHAQRLATKLDIIESEELVELSNFIREMIHEKYFLADLIECGIGFHFGALPQELRERIENQFKKGELKYLFTTSTLLQGVNLPAKNLFILSDKIGRSKLNNIEFRNLAGRAGRLSKELYGNLFVVRLDEKKWTDKSMSIIESNELSHISSIVLSGRKNFYKNIDNDINDKDMTRKSMSQKDRRIISNYSAILAYHEKRNVPSQLRDNFIKKIMKPQESIKKINEYTIPNKVLMQSISIKPKYQEKIINNNNKYIFTNDFDYKNCLNILKILSKNYNWPTEENRKELGNSSRLRYYAVLMTEWIKSKPLNFIVQSTIAYYHKNSVYIRLDYDNDEELFSKDNPIHVNKVINDLLSDVENILRFKIKNYVRNYLMLTDQEENEWQNYLEYGTANKTIIELQRIGFNRQVAIELEELNSNKEEFFKFNKLNEIIDIDKNKILSLEPSIEAQEQISNYL